MNKGIWFCSQAACTNSVWLVQQSPTNAEEWSLVSCVDESIKWTIAGVSPVCPDCGSALFSTLAVAAQEGRLAATLTVN